MKQRIIDAHNHPYWLGMTPEKIVLEMDELGIEKTVMMSWELPEKEYTVVDDYRYFDPRFKAIPLCEVLEAVEKYPDRLIAGWAPDPRDRFTRAKLKAAVETYNIKLYGELKCQMRYDEPCGIATYRYCGELGLPVLFHLECPEFVLNKMSESYKNWPVWYGGDASVVENMCRLCPQTLFIGHGPGLWVEISGDADSAESIYPDGNVVPGGRLIKLLRNYTNLYVDLSAGSGLNALRRDPKHACKFINEFQNRILFGRDAFGSNLLDFINSADLSEKVRNKIFYENAAHLLGD